MKQMKAVIFDMDGVISNTVPLHYEVNKEVANQFDVPFNRQWNQQLQGLSRRVTVQAIIDKAEVVLSEEEFERVCDKKNAHYIQLLQNMTPDDAQPGISAFIENVKKLGVTMVVASASQNASLVLSKLDLLSYFAGVVDVTTLKRGKPDPEIFLKAAEIAGVDPSECVAIEDGEAGLSAILQTEMFSVGVGREPSLVRADFTLSSTEYLTIGSLEEALQKQQKTLYC
ncbi:beta-phosphoglucomutase [Alkalihalobacillus sp. MEB130]|uniref:beta-phosphoglucomutase n=1 Tax=Alkalihalobacillus sp. MEB130 TaxID=2976704 RepID=UPI0028DF491C|nr:beta-phosphoglucomutase [Alkalihalobacillus sp. MEB130]MDT8861908.1 beta-phosphoglucomutase [Alkalihalobacillus sp. MEB130]